MNIEKGYTYKDVYIKPNKRCVVNSRSQCDVSVELGGRKFSIPVVPANMPAVVNNETCLYLSQKGMFYINHRFNVDQVKFYEFMNQNNQFVSISVGVNEDSYNQLNELHQMMYEPDYICIDVAQVWSDKGLDMARFIKRKFPNTFLIAGNIGCVQAGLQFQNVGVDCLKAFQSPGFGCWTKKATGFLTPPISTLLQLKNSTIKIPVIADGGIQQVGDIAKAQVAGAHMIMAGNIFSGFDQSAGNIMKIDGKLVKQYYGSASQHNKQNKQRVQGRKVLVDYKGNMDDFIKQIKDGLQSAVSYAGGKDLKALLNCELVNVNLGY